MEFRHGSLKPVQSQRAAAMPLELYTNRQVTFLRCEFSKLGGKSGSGKNLSESKDRRWLPKIDLQQPLERISDKDQL